MRTEYRKILLECAFHSEVPRNVALITQFLDSFDI